MKLQAEAVALIVICFCFTVGLAYTWGYSAGEGDPPCYVTPSE
jgi:hypothetical protein